MNGEAGDGPTAIVGRAAVAQARLALLAATRRQLAIRLPALGPGLLDTPAELKALRRIATAGRGARIRLLLHEPGRALREDHRLVALAQRLPSLVQVRVPGDETELAVPSACLLGDAGGYLLLPQTEQARGRTARRDPAGAARLRRYFDQAWQRAVPATAWQRIDL